MKKFVRCSLSLILFILCALSVHAQGFGVGGGKSPSLSDPAGSLPFTSLDGRFVIALPEQISSYRPVSFKLPAGVAEGQAFQWRTAEGQFSVIYLDRPEPLKDAAAAQALLEQTRQEALAQISAHNGKLIKENPLTLSTYPGHEMKVELSEAMLTIRTYLVGNRMYQVMMGQAPDQRRQEARALKALESFRLLTPADVEAATKKKIADATPAPLPQEPVVKKPRSDAEDEGLKGKVKVVTSESEDLSGTWAVQGRKPSSTSYYNPQGNLVKSERYDYRGNLSDIEVYGYLDGARVSNEKSISHEYNPPPMMMPPGEAEKKRDTRYLVKYEYKYDDRGRMVEEQYYHNDGSPGMRYAYAYKGNQVEKLAYAQDGSLNQRYLKTLDDKGVEVAETDFNVQKDKEAVRHKYAYEYEFDAKGNWIKRTTKEWVTKDGRSFYEPSYVTYRSISYY